MGKTNNRSFYHRHFFSSFKKELIKNMKFSLVIVQILILLVTTSEVNCKFRKSKEDGKTALEHCILKTMGKLYQAPKNVPKWVLDKVPFFKNKEVHVIPMENPDLNPFAVEEVYEAPSKTVSYKTM